MSVYSEWISKGTKKPGKSRAGLAAALTKALRLDPPMSRTTIYKIIAGTRAVHANELEPAARYMEEPIPLTSEIIAQSSQISVNLLGAVQVGLWIDPEVAADNLGSIEIPRDHVYPNLPHFAFVAKDDSMDSIRVFEGDTIICVDFKATKLKLATGMCLVIERKNRAGLVERSLRAIETNGDIEFKSRCESREYKSVYMKKAKETGEKITIVGLLRRSTREY